MTPRRTVPASRKPAPRPARSARAAATAPPLLLLLGTRKGLFLYRSTDDRRTWTPDEPRFLGADVHHAVLDARDGRTVLAATRSGHLGPVVMRSSDAGRTWREAGRSPRFPRRPGGTGDAVHHVFWFSPSTPAEPDTWYAGTSPPGLFRSTDGGDTWRPVRGWNEHPLRARWLDRAAGVPGGAMVHSILVDPRDARRLVIACSPGGVFASDDRGRTWSPLNAGMAAEHLPEAEPETGQNPHHVAAHAFNPARLVAQTHTGLYRLDRPATRWQRIGAALPAEVGDVGFPLAFHPRDPDTFWTVPMEVGGLRPRTSPGGRPAVWRTRDGGANWGAQRRGFPTERAWWTVKRQALATDSRRRVGLYLGLISGELWASRDGGARWRNLVRHLPPIQAVTTGDPRA